MSRLTHNSTLFPIRFEVMEESVEMFSNFSGDELSLLETTNIALLPDDSAFRYILSFNMRPLLLEDAELSVESQRAYRSGVLLGRRVINNILGISRPADTARITDSQKTQVESNVLRHGGEYIPRCEKGLYGYFERRLAKIDPNSAFWPYLDAKGELQNSILKVSWQLSGDKSFFSERAIQLNCDHKIFDGLKDVFRLFYFLESDKSNSLSVPVNAHSAD